MHACGDAKQAGRIPCGSTARVLACAWAGMRAYARVEYMRVRVCVFAFFFAFSYLPEKIEGRTFTDTTEVIIVMALYSYGLYD